MCPPRPSPPAPAEKIATALTPGSSARPTEEQAVAAIKALKGTITRTNADGSVSWLSLSNIGLKDADLAKIRGFGHLDYLFLIGGDITDTGLAYLADVPTLEGLFISQDKVTGAGLQSLRSLPRLRNFSFSPQTGFKAEFLEPLASCKELEIVASDSIRLERTLSSFQRPRCGLCDSFPGSETSILRTQASRMPKCP